jgi:YidC/Oxa1 family membrane protein insertase
MSEQQRLFLAIAISMIFFVVYSYLMPTPSVNSDQNATLSTTTQSTSNTAPKVTNSDLKQESQAPRTISSQSSKIASINSDRFRLSIDSLGRISSFEVLIDRFREKDDKYPQLIDQSSNLKPLEIRFSDPNLNQEAFSTPYEADVDSIEITDKPQTITLTQKLSGVEVVKRVTFNKDGSYLVKVSLSKDTPYFISPGFRPSVDTSAYVFKGALIRKSDGTIEKVEDGDAKGDEVFAGASIASANDRYYTTAFYNFEDPMNVYITKGENDNPLIFVKGYQTFSSKGYIGPKEFDTLSSIDKRLTDIIEYGFFTFLAKPLFIFLKYIHSIVGNWGWAIVIITILIRLILYPLTYKGMVSMNRLKELQPKIKDIQAKYKGDPQKMNAKMMELYKKHNANPMGGCLPMLMQIPVFFAIYRVLLNAIELKHAPWIGWIQDLSVMDPYFVLPILMGATMYWQQRITPTNYTDPMQEKIMKFLPVIFTFFFVTFPAGLTLYWFVNNLFSVAQQYYVNALFAKEKAAKNG